MSEQELINFDKQFQTCAYCQSIGKEERVYRGHTKNECLILQNTRCNWCGGYGHTGKYCQNKGECPLEIRCLFCFRGKMDEHFYMSHTQDKCRFKREYDNARRDGRPIPTRPRSTQYIPPPKKNIVFLQPKSKIESRQSRQKMYEPTSPYEVNKMSENIVIEDDEPIINDPIYLAFLALTKINFPILNEQDLILQKLKNDNQQMLAKLKNDY